MDLTAKGFKAYLQSAIDEMLKGGNIDPKDFCIGIEAVIAEYAAQECYLTKLKLVAAANGVHVEEAELSRALKPDDWNTEGLWFVLFHLLTDKAPMRIASVTIGYNMDPEVTYDSSVDNGLPVALNRTTETQKTMSRMEADRRGP